MRSLLIVLVTVRGHDGAGGRLDDATAAAIFDGLISSIREVDFVGWYSEGRVVGAVLPQGSNVSVQTPIRITERVLPVVKQHLSDEYARNLRVRVVHVCSSRT